MGDWKAQLRDAGFEVVHEARHATLLMAHVGVAACQPDPRVAWDRDRRRCLPFESAFITPDTGEASTRL